jgi:hypothetical protein
MVFYLFIFWLDPDYQLPLTTLAKIYPIQICDEKKRTTSIHLIFGQIPPRWSGITELHQASQM